jgi:isoquinoline 1-oxidoreductase subunit beta
MADTASFTASRRLVLQVMSLGAAGFAVGCSPTGSGAAAGPVTKESLGPFVKVGTDSTVTVLIKHIEFGQGVSTGLTTIVAEEIDADWSQMRFEHAPAEVPTYGNLAFGGAVQGTGGSTAIWNSWDQLRKAGAAARSMIVQAAAARWGVDANEVTVAKGVVSSGNRTASFGELATEAAMARMPDPDMLLLKEPSEFTLIGKEKGPGVVSGRLDGAGKLNGSTPYALDYHPEGTLTALLARSPRFGGKVASVDDAAARAVAGVTDVVQIGNGVAVVATNFWAAKKGRDALKITWDDSAAETRSTAALTADYKKLLAKPGAEARKEGAGAAGLRGPGKQISMDFEFPYLAHAPMEPLNCVVEFKPGASCLITSGSQMPTVDQAVAAGILGLDPKTVTIDTRLAGGSFGRRATPDADLVAEAAQIAKALNGKAPVKLMWTREDDIRSGKYRPMAVHRMSARFQTTTNSQTGKIEAWTDRTAIQSIMEGTPFLPPGTPDFSAIEGSNDIPYAIPNISVDVHFVKSPISVLWWRSVGHTHTAYAKEHFFDIVAKQAGLDPFAARQALLASEPRLLAVLNAVDEMSGWGVDKTPPPPGRGRGVAVHKSFNSYVAQGVEVTVKPDGTWSVDRVFCAVDCGVVINPDIVRAQMEGGIGYGLSSIMGEAVTIKDGAPEQSNFFDYTVLRMAQMPKIEVFIVPSAEAPTGVGEPGTPVIGPAVANALFAATGKTFPKLPIGLKV